MIILRQKKFSEELKQLISQRMANKASGVVPKVSASAQLAQMKQNTANLGAINDATRTTRRNTGHQLQGKITQAAQSGNNSQKTRLLNKTTTAGVNAGYQEALNRVNNSNQPIVQSNATTIQNAQTQAKNSIGIVGGAKNTWNNLTKGGVSGTINNLATGVKNTWNGMSTGSKAAVIGGSLLLANSIRRRRKAEEEARRYGRY